MSDSKVIKATIIAFTFTLLGSGYPQTDEPELVLQTYDAYARIVEPSPDGDIIATVSDNNVKLWSSITGYLIWTLEDHGDAITDIEFSPKGDLLASASGQEELILAPQFDNSVRLWDLTSGQLIRTFKEQTGIFAISFSPCGNIFAYADILGTIKLWDVEKIKKPRIFIGDSSYAPLISPRITIRTRSKSFQHICALAFTKR